MAAPVCEVQMGGAGPLGTEDGDGSGEDEVHTATLQVTVAMSA